MASKTTNYNLDMPGYNEIADIDVINGNMDKIDVQMKKNADSAQQSKDIVSDEYSATNTYAVGDYCIHENVLYRCKTAITTGEAFDSNKWVKTTCGTEFGELNSNLNEQGLFKKSTIKNNSGISYENGGVYTAEKTFSTDYINVSGYTKITCNKYSFTNNLLWGAFYDSSKNYISGFNQNSKTITVPNNANYIRLTFMNEDIDDVYICAGVIGDVAEEVNELKNDLSTKIYELVGSELWLCISGKNCVLTLNGYNLTGSTNFSKLAEYPPYLVARNVVSKKDGVCMISVDSNGNISASDLQVASSLTGQIFGEVSWVANI